ncbi:MAG: glycosyltransferase family 2 protein [Haloferacaceae archaeon]
MRISVVVPTLDGREHLGATLDALAERVSAEVIVANGPSTDGTTGMVRERDDVDVLVEVSDRSPNVVRNAGIEVATGDVVALVGQDLVVGETWEAAVRDALAAGPADAVTGPARRRLRGGATVEEPDRERIGGQSVTHFDGRNVAFRRPALDALDGFDEYLETDGARDVAHRLAGLDRSVVWRSGMSARREYGADGGHTPTDWGLTYRALAYQLVKNYGLRPGVVRRVGCRAGRDAVENARAVVRGESVPTAWFGDGRRVVTGMAVGAKDGLAARARDRTPTRNPHGISSRLDRAVARYDWR